MLYGLHEAYFLFAVHNSSEFTNMFIQENEERVSRNLKRVSLIFKDALDFSKYLRACYFLEYNIQIKNYIKISRKSY